MRGAAELERRDFAKASPSLRTRVRVPRITVNWVESLPCYDTIIRMMLECVPTLRICDMIIGQGLTVGMHKSVVYDRLQRYKKEKIDLFKKIDRLGGKELAKKFKKMAQQLDELEELSFLYSSQKKRIEKMLGTEASAPIPFTTIDDMIIVAMRLLESSQSMKQDLGINPTAPVNVNLTTTHIEGRIAAIAETRFGKESLGRVLADPVKRARIASIAEKLLSSPKLQAAVVEKLGKNPEPESEPEAVDLVETSGEEKNDERTE